MKIKYIIPALLGCAQLSIASVTIDQGAVFDMRGADASLLPAEGDLFAIVVSSTNDTFENILAGDVINVGATIGGNDDKVIKTGPLLTYHDPDNNNDERVAQAAFSNLQLTNGLDTGDNYAIYWFTGKTSTGAVSEGDIYGVARNPDWVLPPDGHTISGTNIGGPNSADYLLSNFTVQQPVPEPSSTALLGLGALGLVMRRRRA